MRGAPGDQDELSRVERVAEVFDERRDLLLPGELLDVARDDHAPTRQERWRASRVHDARDLVHLVRKIVDDERPVLLTNQRVHRFRNRVSKQRGIAAPQQMSRHARSRARASRSAAMTSAVRRAPRTSWARRTRAPSVTPMA